MPTQDMQLNVTQRQLQLNVTAPGRVTLSVRAVRVPVLSLKVSPIMRVSGSGSAASGYTHTQAVPASVWTIPHGLGFYPAGIVVKDSAGSYWHGEVSYNGSNALTLDFGTASFSGTAYLS